MKVNVKPCAYRYNTKSVILKKTEKTSEFFRVKKGTVIMDRITTDVRMAEWTSLVQQCQSHPGGRL